MSTAKGIQMRRLNKMFIRSLVAVILGVGLFPGGYSGDVDINADALVTLPTGLTVPPGGDVDDLQSFLVLPDLRPSIRIVLRHPV